MLIGAAVAAALAMPVPAQAKPRPKAAVTRRRATAAPAKPKLTPIERLSRQLVNNSVEPSENLSEACSFANAPALLYALEDVVADWSYDKGEFETSAAYAARTAETEKSINADRQTIICKALSDDDTGAKYDADAQRFDISTYGLKRLDSVEKDVGSYVSKTRMGISAKVYQSVQINYEIDFGLKGYDDAAALGCKSSSYGPVRFSVSSVEAPAVKAAGYIVMLGRLRQPFFSKSVRRGEPTLDSPFDVQTTTYSLMFTPTQIVLVDPAGKRIACDGHVGG